MAVYTCDVCGMSTGTMTCGKCGKELQHSTITTDDGQTVHVSQCPDAKVSAAASLFRMFSHDWPFTFVNVRTIFLIVSNTKIRPAGSTATSKPPAWHCSGRMQI